MGTYLDRILEHHRARAALDRRPTAELEAQVEGLPPTRGFRRALIGDDRLSVIAEVKRRSPSKGDLAAGLDPAELAGAYESAGAACLSVLTDEQHFGGSTEDLRAARSSVGLPVLRKDFTVCANDVVDTRLMGADAVLLIVAALDDDELGRFSELALAIGLDVLVEVHDEDELRRALDHTNGQLVGVNQRDLVTFEVDQQRAVRVAGAIPSSAVSVAESGVRGAADARTLAAAGYDAVLVGERLVTATDPRAALEELRVLTPDVPEV
jgi:indole-3-glycerol phosphate synthase